MRTTVRLDDDLFREAKAVAAASGRTLTDLVKDALREAPARRRRGPVRNRLVLRSFHFKGSGPRPGVDLNDSAALLERFGACRAAW